MKLGHVLLAAGIAVFAVTPPAAAEECTAAGKNQKGEVYVRSVTLDFENTARLDAKQLPENAETILCQRSTLIPRANDVRVLTELHLPFGVYADGRTLWIYAAHGQIQTNSDENVLNAIETVALKQWLTKAQARFDDPASWR
jgi:hypothetical protein